jgi:methyl-accepting chemotaxis protein
MPKLSNIRIPVRIGIACLLPLLAFTGLAIMELNEKRAVFSTMNQVAVVVEAAPVISKLVNELQRERGASAGFVTSKGKSFADALRGQRPATDKALANWKQQIAEYSRAAAGTRFAKNLEAADARLNELTGIRTSVDSMTIEAAKATEFYTTAISTLITIIDAVSEMTENGKVIRQASALASQIRRWEFTAQSRALGAQGFASGQFTQQSYQQFMRAQILGDAYAATFRRYATQAQVEYVEKALRGPAQDEFLRMRQLANNSPFDNKMSSVTAPQWFESATRYIDALYGAEEHLAGDFMATVKSVAAEARWGFWSLLLVALGLLAVTSAVTAVVVLSITRPVGQLVHTMTTLAEGRHDIEVAGTERGDELGHMARAVLVFRDAAVEKERLESQSADAQKASEVERQRNEAARAAAAAQVKHVVDALGEGLEQLAKGELGYRISAEFADEYKKVQSDFNAAIAQLQETVGAILTSTREVSNAAGEISSSTTDLSQRTEEQAASLEETSASMEEISATVKQNAENAQQANQFAMGTREVCDRGGEVVAEAVKAMSRIEDSSRKIADIIGVIDEIARQTNLLALNAAVEAARAGEAGRGFAVVASEVRSLAQRSSQAAKDIKDLIGNSSNQVQEGVELVNRAGTSLNEILASIKKVADIVSGIAAASAEQSTGLEQVGKALAQMDEVTQQNSALVEENAATAKTLEHQARAMDERVSFFHIDHAVGGPTTSAQAKPVAATVSRAAPAAPKRAPAAMAKRTATTVRGGGPARRMQTALAAAVQDDPEWKEF